MISHPTASVVILNDDGHVLLLESAKGIGFIYPGGHVDNEDPATAAVREVREEAGLEIKLICEPRFSHPKIRAIPLPFAIIEGEVRDRKIGAHLHVDSVYVARPLTATVTLNHEATGYRWVPVAQVASLPVPAELPSLIAAAAR